MVDYVFNIRSELGTWFRNANQWCPITSWLRGFKPKAPGAWGRSPLDSTTPPPQALAKTNELKNPFRNIFWDWENFFFPTNEYKKFDKKISNVLRIMLTWMKNKFSNFYFLSYVWSILLTICKYFHLDNRPTKKNLQSGQIYIKDVLKNHVLKQMKNQYSDICDF